MKIPATFELTDISKCRVDKPISIIIPMDRIPKYSPIIKPLGEWIKELKR